MPQIAPILGNIALNLAIGVGASLLSQMIKPKAAERTATVASLPKGFAFDMQVGESVPVSAVAGLARARGQLIYLNEYGQGDDYHLQMAVKIGHGWHDGLDKALVDEKVVTLAGSNADPKGRSVVEYTKGGVPYLWFKFYTGAPGQVADPELVARAEPSDRWDALHRFTGAAYMIVTVRANRDLYPGTLPRFGSVWRGLRLFDWRVPGAVWGDQSTYVFTKNPAVIRYNFRRGIFANGVRVLGMGLSAYANDLAYYTACANVCDEPVHYPETDETMARYEFGREIGDDEEKLAVLRQLDDSYCGSSFKRGGADAPIPAQQLVSLATLTDNDRLAKAPVRVDRKGVVSQKRTMWHGQFVSADVGYSLAPYTPRINSTLESVLGGRKAMALDQPYEDRQERAQSRAEIALRRQFYPATRVETFGPKALAYEPGDAVTRVCEWGSMLMVVEKVAPLPDRTGATVTLSEWSNSIVPASGDSFITVPTEPGATPGDAQRTIAVSGLVITPFSRTGGGAVHPYGKAAWTPITDPNVDQVMIRVWPSGGTEADDKEDFFADSKLASTRLVGPLQPMTTYTYKAIPIRSDGRACVWSNTATFTTGTETTPTEVANGSIDLVKLTQELRNRMELVVGDTLDRIAQLEREQEEQASAGFTQSMTNKKRTQILAAKVGSVLAAVIREEVARVEADSAMAGALEQVLAQVDGLFASGMIRFESRVSGGGAEATIAIMVRAGLDDEFADSGIYLRAVRAPGGTTTTDLLFLAQKAYFTDGVNVSQAITLDPTTGTIIFKKARFEELVSMDETSIVLDGTTGFFSFGAP